MNNLVQKEAEGRALVGKGIVGGAGLGALWAVVNEIQRRRRIDKFRETLRKVMDIDTPMDRDATTSLRDILDRKHEEIARKVESKHDLDKVRETWAPRIMAEEMGRVLPKEFRTTVYRKLPEEMQTGGIHQKTSSAWLDPIGPFSETDVLRRLMTPASLILPMAILAFGGSKKLVRELIQRTDKLDDAKRIKAEEDRIRNYVDTGFPDDFTKGAADAVEFEKNADGIWDWVWSKTLKPSMEATGKWFGSTSMIPAMTVGTAMLILGAHARKARKLKGRESVDMHEKELLRGIREDYHARSLDRTKQDLLESVRRQSPPGDQATDRGTDEAFKF